MKDETLDDYLERKNLFLCRQLTDEEIFEVASRFPFIESGYERYEFARAIEERHGIK